MKKTAWTHIRIRKATHARLLDLIASLHRAIEMGRPIPEASTHRGLVSVTMDEAIAILLDREARKKERARQSRRSRREAAARVEEATDRHDIQC